MTDRSEAAVTPSRTMTLHIPVFMVADGTFAPPVVGDVLIGPVDFRETDPTDPDAVTIRAHLTPSDEDPRVWSPPGGAPRRFWSGFLRGDGWTSGWTGSTPRTGQVEITGHFRSGFTYVAHGTVRGRVTRIRIVTERHRQDSSGRWVVVAGFRSVRDVDRADVVDRRDRARRAGDEGVDDLDMDSRVIVDLDLDDVRPLPLRPSIVPGAVSAAAGTTWVIDTELPLLVAVSSDDTVTEYVLPARIGVSRSIWAVPDGCWAAGEDGTYWTPVGGESVLVDDHAVIAGAVNGETLLGCTGDSTWRLCRPGTEPVEVDVAPAAGYVFAVVAHEDGFVAVVRRSDVGTRLVGVSLSGEVQVGPDLTADSAPGQRYRWQRDFFLAGDPLRVVSHVDIGVVEADLTVRDDGERLGRRQFAGGTVGGYGWSLGFLCSGTPTPDELWPLPDQQTFDRATRMLRSPRTVLTLYDPRTMAPLTSVPMRGPTPSVTVGDAGTIVVVVTGGIAAFPATIPVITWPTLVDVAALLDTARARRQSENPRRGSPETAGATPPDETRRQR